LELVWFAFVTNASITVVIPAHNAAQTLLRALHSVAQQTLLPTEIIVANDVSTDNTLQLAKEYAATSAIPMRVLDMPSNVGPGGTRNAAWNAANTEFVAFLDADDQWHPQKLQLQYKAMLQHPNTAMSCHAHTFTTSTSWATLDSTKTTTSLVPFSKFLLRNRCSTPSVMLRRTITQRFQAEKHFAEDYLLWMQITHQHGPALYINASLAHCSNPGYGGQGQSGRLWQMERSELQGFRVIHSAGAISVFTLVALSVWSLFKFGIRVIDSKVVRIRR
jgi:glycosyltransferase involved in cell wall biosynthesis